MNVVIPVTVESEILTIQELITCQPEVLTSYLSHLKISNPSRYHQTLAYFQKELPELSIPQSSESPGASL